MVTSVYIQAPMNYFYSNRINTVIEQPKQIMTFPISWYTNIRIFYHRFGPKAFEGRHIRILNFKQKCTVNTGSMCHVSSQLTPMMCACVSWRSFDTLLKITYMSFYFSMTHHIKNQLKSVFGLSILLNI